ncbi:MAG: GMC oxidoreductase [Roseiflexaceae bacterium]
MCLHPRSSVVDRICRPHHSRNLFLLGSGAFPASGTANSTLTIAALALRTADTIQSFLGQLHHGVKSYRQCHLVTVVSASTASTAEARNAVRTRIMSLVCIVLLSNDDDDRITR